MLMLFSYFLFSLSLNTCSLIYIIDVSGAIYNRSRKMIFFYGGKKQMDFLSSFLLKLGSFGTAVFMCLYISVIQNRKLDSLGKQLHIDSG